MRDRYADLQRRSEDLDGRTARGRVLEIEALCRDVSLLGLVAEAVLKPWASCGDGSRQAGEQSVIEWDFIRILVAEILNWEGQTWEQDALIRALARALVSRLDAEAGPGGLIDLMAADGMDGRRFGEYLDLAHEQTRESFQEEGWWPPAPQALEGLRQAMATGRPPAARVAIQSDGSGAL